MSHWWASRRAGALLGRPVDELRLVTCHVGGGASLAAVRGGRSVDTTMGYTPLDGLVMASRSGAVDPGALLAVQRRHGVSAEAMETALNRRSGVAGLSGVSGDLRDVEGAARSGSPRAVLALEVHAHRLRAGVAAMAAAMAGLDALVFTGEAGAGWPPLRERACTGLGFLGVRLDGARNQQVIDTDADVSPTGTPVPVLVVHTREDLAIAAEVRRVLGST